MKIDRKTAIKSIIFLCILLLISVIAFAIVIKLDEIKQNELEQKHAAWERAAGAYHTPFIPKLTPIIESETQSCNYSDYRDPKEFKRIYY